jgi:hypothetical protein
LSLLLSSLYHVCRRNCERPVFIHLLSPQPLRQACLSITRHFHSDPIVRQGRCSSPNLLPVSEPVYAQSQSSQFSKTKQQRRFKFPSSSRTDDGGLAADAAGHCSGKWLKFVFCVCAWTIFSQPFPTLEPVLSCSALVYSPPYHKRQAESKLAWARTREQKHPPSCDGDLFTRLAHMGASAPKLSPS